MKKTKNTKVMIDGEAPYTLAPNNNPGKPKATWSPNKVDTNPDVRPARSISDVETKAFKDKAFIEFDEYEQHRKQEEKHWDWQEGTPVFDETVRTYQTDGRTQGDTGYGWDLHRGTVTRDDDGRASYTLGNPVMGFSNNRVMKHVLDTEPLIGKNPDEQVAYPVPGGKTQAVDSAELNVHYGVHYYDQPERI